MFKNTIKRLIIMFTVLCIMQAQNPADAKGFSFFKKNKTVENQEIQTAETADLDDSLELKTEPLDIPEINTGDTENAEAPKAKKEKKKKEKKVKKEKSKKLTFKRKIKKQQIEDTTKEDEFTSEDSPYDPSIFDTPMIGNDDDIDNVIYIKNLEIVGNNMIDASYIKSILTAREGHIYDRKQITKDLNALYATGYFSQNIRAVPIKLDDGNVRLRIVVEENVPIKGFMILGNESVPYGDIISLLEPLEGQPQNIIQLNSTIEQIQEMYSAKGYILARITNLSDDPDGVITIRINEGTIGNINVVGNYKTKDFIVKRNILLSPGEVYNENVMRSDTMRLMGTQAFKTVNRKIVMNEETGLYDVTIELDEQKTGRISLGIGVDSSSGFFGSVGFGENNFRGLGQKLNLNLMAGTGILMDDNSVLRRANWQAELSFLEPYFKRENQSLGFRAFFRSFGSYQVPLAVEKRYGGDVTLARVFEKYPSLTGSISLGAEKINLSEGEENKMRQMFTAHGLSMQQRAKQLEGGFYLRAIPAITFDTRDNTTNPRHGHLARISLEEAVGIGADTYGKLDGVIKKFVPAGRKSSVVLTARAGGVIHGDMPEFAMYTLGGPYTIRGFNISEVGQGDGYMMGSIEYRTPIPFIDRLTSRPFVKNIRLAAFVDGGKIFSQSLSDRLYDRPGYAVTAGVGIRIFIPGMGPVNLDYAIPFTNTRGSRSSGFFTFGMGDML